MKTDIIPLDSIQAKIVLVRGENVLLDQNLAEMYGVETFDLNKAVKRNSDRFHEDSMFQLYENEWKNLEIRKVNVSGNKTKVKREKSLSGSPIKPAIILFTH